MSYVGEAAISPPLRHAKVAIFRASGDTSTNRGPATISVILADHAELMHLAMRELLARNTGYYLTAAAATVSAAEQLAARSRPMLLICEVDIGGESGLGLCRRVRRVSPATRVVILTDQDDPALARSALATGASGYLLKDSGREALLASLDLAAAGFAVLDDRLGRSQQRRISDAADDYGFSRRERDVLGQMVAGLDNKSIARTLCIAEDTVKTHMKAIFRKLGARDRAHAVALALGTAPDGHQAGPLIAVGQGWSQR